MARLGPPLLLLLLLPALARALNASMTLSPPALPGLLTDHAAGVVGNLTVWDSDGGHCRLQARVEDARVATLLSLNHTALGDGQATVWVRVSGRRLGQTRVMFSVGWMDDPDQWLAVREVLNVTVLRVPTVHEQIFMVVNIVMLVVLILMMGCDLDPNVIAAYLRRPLAPAIGFVCQFILMPVLALGIASVFPLDKAFGFGLLTVGCSPGGGTSNVWTILLEGDLNLSMTMTFISSVCAIAMMPLWLLLLGHFFIDQSSVVIPYSSIALNLLQVVLPCLMGMFLRWIVPRLAMFLRRGLRVASLLYILMLITYGTYTNVYMYGLMADYPVVIPAGALLPWLGFLFGATAAAALQLGKARAVTIGLETGCQNTGIAILILLYSMPKPTGELAAVVPVVVVVLTPVPLLLALAVRAAVRCWRRRKEQKTEEEQRPLVESSARRRTEKAVAEGPRDICVTMT